MVAVLAALAFTAYAYRKQMDLLRRKIKQYKRMYAEEHQQRIEKHEQVKMLGKRIVDLEGQAERHLSEMANMKRVASSPLYREALEDKQAQAVQAALQVRIANDALRIANDILKVGKDLPK